MPRGPGYPMGPWGPLGPWTGSQRTSEFVGHVINVLMQKMCPRHPPGSLWCQKVPLFLGGPEKRHQRDKTSETRQQRQSVTGNMKPHTYRRPVGTRHSRQTWFSCGTLKDETRNQFSLLLILDLGYISFSPQARNTCLLTVLSCLVSLYLCFDDPVNYPVFLLPVLFVLEDLLRLMDFSSYNRFQLC